MEGYKGSENMFHVFATEKEQLSYQSLRMLVSNFLKDIDFYDEDHVDSVFRSWAYYQRDNDLIVQKPFHEWLVQDLFKCIQLVRYGEVIYPSHWLLMEEKL